ncbi:MAG: UbiA family prenyltransferase [Planctomycetota bacterium]
MPDATTAERPTPDAPAVGGRLPAWLEAARPHHWLKNALLFVPMWLGHDVTLGNALLVLIGAACFSAVASAGYLVNDLLDVDADRAHRTKRHRPVASGRLSVGAARLVAALAIGGATLVSVVALGAPFTGLLLLYLALTLAYSTWVKRLAFADVLMLAGLYTLRLLAGGVAVDVELSSWLLAFSTFVFLSLAFAKRYTEVALHLGETDPDGKPVRVRGYLTVDAPLLVQFGVASAFASVLVFALYVDSAAAGEIYHRPALLWLLLPVMLYWIGRVWLLTRRGEMHDDPVVFALRDRVSWACGAMAVLLVMLATD